MMSFDPGSSLLRIFGLSIITVMAGCGSSGGGGGPTGPCGLAYPQDLLVCEQFLPSRSSCLPFPAAR